jgi:hypothetical protein
MRENICLPIWPLNERQQLEYGDLVSERDVRRLLTLHQRAAVATPLLLKDGWTLWYVRYAIQAEHPKVATWEEVRARLAILGIPLDWVERLGSL